VHFESANDEGSAVGKHSLPRVAATGPVMMGKKLETIAAILSCLYALKLLMGNDDDWGMWYTKYCFYLGKGCFAISRWFGELGLEAELEYMRRRAY
jgi:hypothetical protein